MDEYHIDTNRTLHEEATICRDAVVTDSVLGRWTEVGERTLLEHFALQDFSYIGPDSEVANTEIGKFTSIASKVRINPGNHPWWRPTLHHFTYRPGKYGMEQLQQNGSEKDSEVFDWRKDNKVTIGHDVWIGHGVIILPGVTVGDGAIIGAASVVTKDVKSYIIVVGNPANILRPRFATRTQRKCSLTFAGGTGQKKKSDSIFLTFRKVQKPLSRQ
ncbi:Streptogramin A acetyltransferase [Grimontia marina]|uniref:Streptogramin A acetyltransferase n=1 Tax=Grimontia marina TaxID=646534 RepID=A0A128FI80_9GAMM|nr:DapH/DapD/GlmU-related protein [Grimontia marina]CZF85976.1 Streptogramin A acetyltransferase [Grimontia marina]